MADLNALIAQGAQFRVPPPVDPMGNMPQLMQMRAAQNQNALAQYQLGAAQRTDEQQSALNALARNPNYNPNTPEGMRLAQQYGAPGYALVKSAREASSAGVAQDQARSALLKEKMSMLPDAYRMADTPEAYAQLQESIHADPVIGPWLNSIGSTKEKGVAALQDALTKPNGFAQLRMGSMQSVKDILEGNKPLVVAAGSSVFDPKSQSFVGTAASNVPDAELMARMGFPSTPEGYAAFNQAKLRQERLLTPEEEAQKLRLAIAGRTPAQLRAEPALRTQQVTMSDGTLGIMNMDTGAVTPATLGGIPISQGDRIKPLTEQQTIKLRTEVAKDYKSASTTLSQMDDLLASIKSVKTAPGLSAATGYTGVYLPSFSEGKAATAETRVANLRGKVTALGKATAAMSGAIGSIANQEWKILADQVANIDLVKGKGPLLEQIDLIETQARGAMERIRDQYEKTRAEDFKRFPQFKDLPAPAAPVADPLPGAPARANAAAASASAGVKFLGFEPGTQ